MSKAQVRRIAAMGGRASHGGGNSGGRSGGGRSSGSSR
jgi:hypothetical protein